jgi:hypothetical protein
MGSPAGLKAARAGQEPLRLGIDCQPFYIPKCANRACRAPLADAAGNPRWDILEDRFVCLGSCMTVRKRGRS